MIEPFPNFDLLVLLLPSQCLDLVFVGIEDILLTAPEVRVHLAREEGVLGDICLS